jgi:branched-chain amino acid transport system ATP-binding protein
MALLDLREIGVRFGGLQALDDVSLDVDAGRVTGLIGPNGAGKTTLFNVVTGLQAPTTGQVVIDGQDITLAKPHVRARKGIGRTFQRLETFGTLSARDNVLVGAEMRRRWSRERFDVRELADELIDRIGLRAVADEKVDKLSTGTARLVEVARALACKPRVLLLDEPSLGLAPILVQQVFSTIKEINAQGTTVLLVEQNALQALSIAHRAYAMASRAAPCTCGMHLKV